MKYESQGNYDLDPTIEIELDYNIEVGTDRFIAHVLNKIDEGNLVFALDLYPGVNKQALLLLLSDIANCMIVDTSDSMLTKYELDSAFKDNITNDRVFGTKTLKKLEMCFDPNKVADVECKINNCKGKVVFIVGVGAKLFCNPDVHYYFNITRWEIQLRFRTGASNWLFENSNEPVLSKYKIGFFIEWRLADIYKVKYMDSFDYIVDANNDDCLKVLEKKAYIEGLKQVSEKPFRMQPYFDKSVWGGQWMKNHFKLADNVENYGWAFDGVPEENSLKLSYNGVTIEFPTMDLVKLYPQDLLGNRVYGRFGAEFPIRFDLLDTYEGGNLSLQVHPLTEYIQTNFGMPYTQDESYYFLDSEPDGCVYIGVKPNINPEEMKKDLEIANSGGKEFDAEKYVNKIPVKKHDHVLIPAGTVHCSGKNTTVLEISATTYIFTFKLWDWGRIGLDGLPRPVHINHGMQNIQFDRDTEWVKKNLIHQEKIEFNTDGIKIEKTGLHELEFIDTRRYSLEKSCEIECNDSVTVLNLVEGKSAVIKSASGIFTPQVIHYAETFIIPAGVKKYILCPEHDGEKAVFLVATIRG